MTQNIVKFVGHFMQLKNAHISSVKKDRLKRSSLVKAIAPKAFWSYPKIAPSRVADGNLIEKVLIYGSDNERSILWELFPSNKIQRIWERRLIIQEPRLHSLNHKIASSFFNISNPEDYIQESYKKHNLYARFSA